jgi:hypothetical protein
LDIIFFIVLEHLASVHATLMTSDRNDCSIRSMSLSSLCSLTIVPN